MKRRFVAICLVIITTMSLFTGCNKSKADKMKKDKFYLYSWNPEAGQRIKALYEAKYPNEKGKIEAIDLGGTDTYQEKLDRFWKDESNPKYPDMFCMEADYIRKYTDSAITLDVVSDIGVDKSLLDDMYPYTVEMASTDDGKIKGLSWQACPGCIAYRRDLAKKYFNVDTPEQFQLLLKDWSTMRRTALRLKNITNGSCRLFCGYSEMERLYQYAQTKPWVEDNKLSVDIVMKNYMTSAKYYSDNGCVSAKADDQQWKDNWKTECGKDNVLCYLSCTWFNQYSLKEYIEQEGKSKPLLDENLNPKLDEDGKPIRVANTDGKWGMVQGPIPFSWGGTWLAAAKNCADKETAKKIFELLCDKETMKLVYTKFEDFPNNKTAIEELYQKEKADPKSKTTPVIKRFGGQSSLEFFKDKAASIRAPKICKEDFYAIKYFNWQVDAYVAGTHKTLDDALQAFEKKMKDTYTKLQ